MARKVIFSLIALLLFPLAGRPAESTDSPLAFEHRIIDPKGPENPWIKIAADLDGSGIPSILIGGQNGPLVGYTPPDWKKAPIAGGGYHTVDGECGDIDGDGDLDIVIGMEYWYENPRPLGQPARDPWTVHPLSDLRTHDVELADLNGDGQLDIIARDQSGFGYKTGNRIHLRFQETRGRWSSRALDCPHGEGLCAGDLDRDGDPDILIGGRWYENPGRALQDPWNPHIITTHWHEDTSIAMGDINGDGRPDVVLTRSEGPYRLSWFEAPATPQTPEWKEHAVDPSVDFAHGVALGDLDNDGDLDIATAEMHQSARRRVMIFWNGDAGAKWTPQILAETGSHNIRLADFNQDGRLDILGANWSGAFQPVEIWMSK